MSPHVLVAVDDFTELQIARIAEALAGWATWERVPHAAAERYAERLQTSRVLIGWPQPEWLPPSAVEYFQLPSVGCDPYLDRGLPEKPNFTLCNARGVMTIAVAEHFVAMLMALARRLPQHVDDRRTKRWQRQPVYSEVAGTTVCLVGLGEIGTAIARRCLGLEMNVVGVRKRAASGHELVRRVYPLDRLTEAISQADHVVLTLPATPETVNLVDAGVLAAMKPGAYLYNLARGGLVDEDALVAALHSGHLAGAGLDVFAQEPLPDDSPLWELDNVIVTPHAAGRSVREFDRLCDLFVENLGRYRRGVPLVNAVALDGG
jgi:phosphoglycerate dehydrogenase-like enzyme